MDNQVQLITDFSTITPIKETISYVDQLRASAAAPPPAAPAPMLPGTAVPTPPVASSLAPPPPPAPAPVPDAPPVFPTDVPRVQDRINKLWAQKKSAEERLAELEARLAAPPAPPVYPPSPPVPAATPPDLFSFAPASPAAPPPPAGTPLSREEFQAIMQAERAERDRAAWLASAQSTSRQEAASEFPDVFASPEASAAFTRIWESDPVLRADPHGPMKAAMFARAMSFRPSQVAANSAAAALKSQIGIGNTGDPNAATPPPDNSARAAAALAIARETQRTEDFQRYLLIRSGQM